MKIGTIIKNNWASEGNPAKYFIYTGIEGKYATGVCLAPAGRLEKVLYYKDDFRDAYTHEGEKVFESVGYCDGFDIIKADLQSILGEV